MGLNEGMRYFRPLNITNIIKYIGFIWFYRALIRLISENSLFRHRADSKIYKTIHSKGIYI